MNARYTIAIGLAALLVESVLVPGCSGDDTAAPPQGQAGTPAVGSGGNGNAGTSSLTTGGSTGGDNTGSAGTSVGSGGSGGSGGSNSAAGSSGSGGSGGSAQSDASTSAEGSSGGECPSSFKDKMPWPAGQAAPCTKACATVADGGNDGTKVCAKVAFDSMECQKAASCKANCTSGDCAVCGACM